MYEKFDYRKFNVLMAEQDITQKELAEKIGMTRTSICRYANRITSPTITTIGKLAKGLNTTADDLIRQ